MKAWKKGAIIGGIWGILGPPVSILIGLVFWWEKSVPKIIEWILSIVINLPNTIIGLFLSEQIEQFVTKNPSYLVLMFVSNFLGWIIIGAILGYAYSKLRRGVE